MKITKLLIFISLFLLTACEKIEHDAPDCIKDLIKNNIGVLTLCETGASVTQYLFQGQDVFVFDPGNCGADMAAPVYNDECVVLGDLGGIRGNLFINGERFDQGAIYIKPIWTDNSKK